MNWFMIAGGLLVAIGIIFLIKYLIGNTTSNGEKTEIPEIPIEPSIKPKMSYGKIWNWVIPILIISAIIGAILIVPKYYKNGDKVTELSIPASYSWKKKPHQYGYNSNERFGGPYDAVITKNDSNFCFTVYGGESNTHFYGKNKNGKIEGWWEQSNPRAGGKWDLKKDAYDSTLYTGICTDPYLPDGTDIELRLKY